MKKFLDSILFVETRLRSIGGAQLIDRADQCAAWARQIASTPGVVDDARFDEIDSALGEFLSMARDADPQLTGLRRVTFRKAGGKAHRGIVHEGCERPSAVCGCPGASNGSLTQGAEIIAEGWEKANCCPNDRPRKRRVLKPLNAVKAPKEKGPIVPAAAKAEMRFARQCREAAANWANGHGYSKNEHEVHRNVEHFNNEASAHEQRAAQIIAEAEGVRSFEAEHAEKATKASAPKAPRVPKDAQECQERSKAAYARAKDYAADGEKGAAHEARISAGEWALKAERIIAQKAAASAAKAERAAVKERLANGTATLREKIGALKRADLMKLVKDLGLIRANGSNDFSKMPVEGLRMQLNGRGCTSSGAAVPASIVLGLVDVLAQGKARLAASIEAEKRAELAAEDKANADFAAFAEEQAVYVVKRSSSVNWGVYNTERKCFVYSCHCEDAAKTEAARRNAAWIVQEDDEEDVYDSMSQEEAAGNNGFGGCL
jgi:hypothetical protein